MELNEIYEVEKKFDAEIEAVAALAELETIRVKYLGKKGYITDIMSKFREVPADQKKEFGQKVNALKNKIENKIEETKLALEQKAIEAEINSTEMFDYSLPVDTETGSLNPRTIIQKQVVDIFKNMGFVVEDGNEVETDYNNFESVNVPKSHPARDTQDTFWLSNGQLLKTQTSAAQNRILRTYGPVCKVIFPGRVFRNEQLDARHENTFFQLEGVVVGKNITVANLIYFEKAMLKALFKKDIEVRLRPGFFPFTEPSYEMDAKCPFCGGRGCQTCGGSGWIELCPCGMIHPNVLKMAGIDPDEYNGFAFGLGFDRLVMIRTNLDDIRHLNSNNLKVMSQFKTKM
ncbi:MAG: phenylalanine--tRNA ligase subunit alpha [Clostridia bacterium]|nr:phenylalanine--tRNA ligase subunit alpha [Clostridia bacterium]